MTHFGTFLEKKYFLCFYTFDQKTRKPQKTPKKAIFGPFSRFLRLGCRFRLGLFDILGFLTIFFKIHIFLVLTHSAVFPTDSRGATRRMTRSFFRKNPLGIEAKKFVFFGYPGILCIERGVSVTSDFFDFQFFAFFELFLTFRVFLTFFCFFLTFSVFF